MTASTSAGDTDAAIRMKSTPTSSCTRVCWNSSISDTSIERWLASAMPIAVVATKPASSRMRSAATSAATTVASVTGTAWRGARRCDSAQQEPQRDDPDGGDGQADRDAEDHLARTPRIPAERGVEHDDPEQRAHRVDEHALPREQRADLALWTHEGQQRQHHRRAGDHEDRADQERDPLVEPADEQRRRGGDRRAT